MSKATTKNRTIFIEACLAANRACGLNPSAEDLMPERALEAGALYLDSLEQAPIDAPNAEGMFTWIYEIQVHTNWVEDGFNLEEENLNDAILSELLGYANASELKVKVLRAPDSKEIARAQGFDVANLIDVGEEDGEQS